MTRMVGMTSLWLLFCLLTSSEAFFAVNQTTDPTEVQPHLTTDLTINCSIVYTPDNTTSLIRLPLSLTIKKSTIRNPHNYTTVAFINSIENKIDQAFSKNADVSGHLSSQGNGSYLQVHWSYPQFEMTGNYVCELLGFDARGQAITINDTAQVTDHKPNQNDALKKIEIHDKQIAELKAKIDQLSGGSALDNLGRTMFLHNATVNGTTYLLSRPFLQNSAMAESVCQLYGGYLVEFDLQEYLVIKGILNNASSNIYYDIVSVLVGITDEVSEATWRFRAHPKLSVPPFIHWGQNPQQPDGGRKENCAVLVGKDTWRMADVPCYDNAAHVHFMCEMPKV